jgi:hypothetical protein
MATQPQNPGFASSLYGRLGLVPLQSFAEEGLAWLRRVDEANIGRRPYN